MATFSLYRFLALIGILLYPLVIYAATKNDAGVLTVIHTKSGSCIPLTLEKVSTPKALEQGLMDRSTLAPYDGMAFMFKDSAIRRFWMKNTLIPLDILFVDEAGNIVYIAQGKPLSEEPLGPNVPVTSVIEIALGRAQKEQIMVGDSVRYGTHCPSDIDTR